MGLDSSCQIVNTPTKKNCVFEVNIIKLHTYYIMKKSVKTVGSQPQTRHRANGQGSALSASQSAVALSTLFPPCLHQIGLLLHRRRYQNQTINHRRQNHSQCQGQR